MSTDNKTLADAQPGGRVRLGDALLPCPLCGNDAVFVPYKNNGLTLKCKSMGCIQRHQRTLRYGIEWLRASMTEHWNTRALSAQPSPGGQDALRVIAERLRGAGASLPAPPITGTIEGSMVTGLSIALALVEEALAARQPSKQPDSVALGEATEFCTQKAARQPVGEPVCSGGFVISNGSGEKYMAWGQVGPEWTADRSAALWLVRRADAEALAAENEDAWSILPVERCALPPNGWACTLADGHEGPCPTIAAPPAQAVDLVQLPRYEAIGSDGMNMERVADGRWVKRDDVLALINSQAVCGEPSTATSRLTDGIAASIMDQSQFRDALVWAEDAADCSSHPDHKSFRFAFTELLGMIDSKAERNG